MDKEKEKEKIEEIITDYINKYNLSEFDVKIMKYYDKKRAIIK